MASESTSCLAMDEISATGHKDVALDIEPVAENLSCKQFCINLGRGIRDATPRMWAFGFLKFGGLLLSLYFFLFALDLMGGAFKVLGGCSAGGLFAGIDNPIAGLMIGILATVLVQSSSTSTSIVVALVGSGSMPVRTAIPVIMGANIGTSVTNTIVSMGQSQDPNQLEKAFAGAVVHDMFNFLSVLVLLPIEILTGLIYHITFAMMPDEVVSGKKWTGPIKLIVGPFVKLFLNVDKKVIQNVALGKTTCAATYAAVAAGEKDHGLIKGGVLGDVGSAVTQSADMAAGAVALLISILLLCLMLMCLVKLLQSIVLGSSETMLRKATDLHPVLGMLVGMGITILVQSSSVTTSVLTPLVGVGVLPLERMFPLTLGANIGTTFTAVLASLVSSKPEAVQIALAHLFFNLLGILIWYPIPFMRRRPLNAARALGAATRRLRIFPIVYIVFAFVVCPMVLMGISALYMSQHSPYRALAVILTVFVVMALAYAIYWWNRRNGKQAFLGMLDARQEKRTLNKGLVSTIEQLKNRVQALEQGGKGYHSKQAAKIPADIAESETLLDDKMSSPTNSQIIVNHQASSSTSSLAFV